MNNERFKRIQCDWNSTSCTQLSAEEIVPNGDYGGLNCSYLNVLDSGDPCTGACRLKDYEEKETVTVAEFKRKLSSGAINLHK